MRHAGVVVVLMAAGCATQPLAGDSRAAALGLAPYASQEECHRLVPGDRLDYRFTSTAPVAFNIHYSDGNAVVMPISRDAVTADSGIYQPVSARNYCLAWEAGAEGASVDYHVAVHHRSP